MDDEDEPVDDGIRADFKPVEHLLHRALVYSKQFTLWDHKDWPEYKKNGDYDRLPLSDEQMGPFERLYAHGRQTAIDLSFRLCAFNDAGDYPTFKSFVDDLEVYLTNWTPDLATAIENAELMAKSLPFQSWSINEMITLAHTEVDMAKALGDWIRLARQSPLYQAEQGSTMPAAPTRKEPPPVTKATTTKSRVFVGSSTEGKAIAHAIQANLDHDAEVTVWDQGVFGLSGGTLESLVKAVDNFDFAILVLTPDDLTTKRGASKNSPRDNVIFELGLFMGALGRDRTFMVYCRDETLDLPSDLAGITPATYAKRSDKNMRAALGAACTDFKDAMARQGSRAPRASRSDILDNDKEAILVFLSLFFDKKQHGPNLSEIAETTTFTPTVARHHLDELIAAGLVEISATLYLGPSIFALTKEGRRYLVGNKLAT